MSWFSEACGIYAAVFALDFVWVFYTRATVGNHAVKAGLWAVGIILCSGFAQIGYTHDPTLLLPAALGAFTGTWLANTIWWGV